MPFGILLPAAFLCTVYLAVLLLATGLGDAGLLWAGLNFRKSENRRETGLPLQFSPAFYGVFAVLLTLFFGGFGRMAWEMREEPLESFLTENGPRKGARAEGVIEKIKESEGMYSLTLSDAAVTAGDFTFEGRRLMVTVDEKTIRAGSGEEETDGRTEAGSGNPGAGGQRAAVGKRITVEGKLELFSQARNPGEFDYRLYYRGLKLCCRLRADRAEICGGRPSLFQTQVSRFRAFAKKALKELCRGEDAGIFCAVLLGDKSELSDDISDLFGDSGIAHILAVSGLHVSLIGMSLYGALRRAGLGYGKAGLISAAVLFFYGSVTGFGPSVFRAVFMVFCAFLAAYLGRTYDLLSAMALSLLLLSADSPFLLFSGGLQLSYGAVAAIGLENNRVQREGRRSRLEEWGMPGVQSSSEEWERTGIESRGELKIRPAGVSGNLTATLRLSLMIQLTTLPIVLYHFFRFPVWGIVLNLIVIPFMSYAAGSGILAVGVYAASRLPVFPPLSGVFYRLSCGLIGPGHFIFLFYRKLCELAQKLPFASLAAGRPDGWKIAVYYFALACLCLYGGNPDFSRGRQSGRRRAAVLAAAAVLLCTRPAHGLEIWFLDVGQGDGVWIQTEEATILSDCGSSQYRNVGRDRLIPFLESRGVKEIDYVLVSHGDSDHINGITWLLEQEPEIRVNCLVMPKAGEGEEIYESLEALAAARGTKVWYMQRGEQITAGRLTLDCLHPFGAEDGSREETEFGGEKRVKAAGTADRNGHSLVFSLHYRDYSMLLTGDIGQEQEAELISSGDFSDDSGGEVQTAVLKAAHHGSSTSSGEPFLRAVRPGIAILSYGEGNTYGHPSEAVVKRLREQHISIWRTAVSGAIQIRTDGSRMKIRGFLSKRVDREGGDGL